MKTSRRKMSLVQLTFVAAANMLGAGIIMLPTKLAEVGTISIISWIITSLGSLALALTFARCGMFSTKPGGMGGYAEYRFGCLGHFMTSYSYSVSIVIANVAIAISAVGYGAGFFGAELTPLQTCLYTIALLDRCCTQLQRFTLLRQTKHHNYLGSHHPCSGHFPHRLVLVRSPAVGQLVESEPIWSGRRYWQFYRPHPLVIPGI